MFDDDEDLHPQQIRADARNKRRDSGQRRTRTTRQVQETGETVHGVVVEVARGAAVVSVPTGLVDATVDDRALTRLGTQLAVGDAVQVALTDGTARLIRVDRRRTSLSRSDPHNPHRERVIVANVDTVGVVSAATDPPFRPRLVDRYLVAILRGGAEVVVVVTKVDLADRARRQELQGLLAPYEGLGIPVVTCSAQTGEGIDRLMAVVSGRRVAFVGHSGTGKSSLITALGSPAEVGDLSAVGRGRHTTTSSGLHVFPDGTEIVDTPGVRQFAPWQPTLGHLRAAFPDLTELSAGCAFGGCTHSHEPGCAVIEAVASGRLAGSRHDSWLRLLDDVG